MPFPGSTALPVLAILPFTFGARLEGAAAPLATGVASLMGTLVAAAVSSLARGTGSLAAASAPVGPGTPLALIGAGALATLRTAVAATLTLVVLLARLAFSLRGTLAPVAPVAPAAFIGAASAPDLSAAVAAGLVFVLTIIGQAVAAATQF